MCLLSWWEKQLLGKGYNYLTHAVSISIFVMIGYKMATTKFILVSWEIITKDSSQLGVILQMLPEVYKIKNRMVSIEKNHPHCDTLIVQTDTLSYLKKIQTEKWSKVKFCLW